MKIVIGTDLVKILLMQDMKPHLESMISRNILINTPCGLEKYYMIRVHMGVDGQAVAGTGISLATMVGSGLLGIGLVPFTGGGSLLMAGNAVTSAGMAFVSADGVRPSRTVYFNITGDDSKWEVSRVQWYGIKQVAENICKWSNEVYTERYINQAYIEYRPPTPY